MSGHSKWSQIKHKKAITDAKKAKIFSKIARMITVAAREKGYDLKMNPSLRIAVEKAKSMNMPTDNIERAIKKGIGESGEKLENAVYGAYGPGGAAFLIEIITDNKNRATAEIKHILSKYGGRLAEPGNVEWLFEKKGIIEIIPENLEQKAEIELAAIEAGAADVDSREECVDIYVETADLEKIKEIFEKMNFKINSASIDFIAKNPISVTNEEKNKIETLLNAIDENDDTQEIYSNVKN